MYGIAEFVEETTLRLGREIKDLDDVRHAMAALEAIRKRQIEIDMSLGPIEVHINLSKLLSKLPPSKKENKTKQRICVLNYLISGMLCSSAKDGYCDRSGRNE